MFVHKMFMKQLLHAHCARPGETDDGHGNQVAVAAVHQHDE